VGEQQGVRQRADTSRDGRDCRGDPASGLEIDVADERVADDVDPDIDDNDASAEHRPGHEARVPGGHDEDLGVLDVTSEVARPRVTHSYCRVLADKQERCRHADDRRAADDDGPATLDRDPGATQDLDGSMGGRGQEPVVAQAKESGVQRVDPVDVLRRVDRIDHGT
jgi:hypothetical protein